jgi:hypothetical protein
MCASYVLQNITKYTIQEFNIVQSRLIDSMQPQLKSQQGKIPAFGRLGGIVS